MDQRIAGNITECGACHAARIAEIEKQCFSEPWSEKALDGFFSFGYNGAIGFETQGLLVGYVTYTVSIDEIQIANVAVDTAFRRRGIGSVLLSALREKAETLGCNSVTLEVRASNEAARALYEAGGYGICGTRKNYYTRPKEDAILMTLTLCAPKGTANT